MGHGRVSGLWRCLTPSKTKALARARTKARAATIGAKLRELKEMLDDQQKRVKVFEGMSMSSASTYRPFVKKRGRIRASRPGHALLAFRRHLADHCTGRPCFLQDRAPAKQRKQGNMLYGNADRALCPCSHLTNNRCIHVRTHDFVSDVFIRLVL